MNRFIGNILLFIPIGIIVYITLVILFGQFSPIHPNLNYQKGSYGHMHTRIQEVKETSNVDILFLGSSHAYRGFDVRQYENLGYKVFNLGSSSQSPIQSRLLLERYLKKLNPKHIVFEINPGRLASDGVESSIDIIANDKNDRYSIEMTYITKHLKTLNTLVYGIYRDLVDDGAYSEPSSRGEDQYINGGFVEKKMKYYDDSASFESKRYEWKDYQIKALDDIIAMLASANGKITFVQAPITKKYYSVYENADEFDEYINSLGVYHNFNKTMQLVDTLDFYDARHLNQNGVKKFNKELIRLLEL